MNIIKNPEFVFDIYKSEVVDASLSTLAQTFIDSCAMTESDFGAVSAIIILHQLIYMYTHCCVFIRFAEAISPILYK